MDANPDAQHERICTKVAANPRTCPAFLSLILSYLLAYLLAYPSRNREAAGGPCYRGPPRKQHARLKWSR